MKPAITALVLAILVSPAAGEISGLTPNVARFLAIFNGRYDNQAQELTDAKDHDFVHLEAVPVTSSALPGRTLLYMEYAYGELVFDQELCDLSEDSRGVVHLKVYNISVTQKYKPGEYKLDNFQKLTRDDLTDTCHYDAEMELTGPGEFFGTWPTCRTLVKGKPTMYTAVLKCNSTRFTPPDKGNEEYSPVPYNMLLNGDKFKIPGISDDFVSPCQ